MVAPVIAEMAANATISPPLDDAALYYLSTRDDVWVGVRSLSPHFCLLTLLTFCSVFSSFSHSFLTVCAQALALIFLSFLSLLFLTFSLSPCFAVLRAGVLHTVRALPAAETLQQSAEQPAGDRDVRRRLGHLRGNDRAPFSNDMSLICSQIPLIFLAFGLSFAAHLWSHLSLISVTFRSCFFLRCWRRWICRALTTSAACTQSSSGRKYHGHSGA